MADAKKCDICGGYHDTNAKNASKIRVIDNSTGAYMFNKDACPDCVAAFYEFMNSRTTTNRKRPNVKGSCEDCKYEHVDEDSDPCAYCTSKNSQFESKEENKDEQSE